MTNDNPNEKQFGLKPIEVQMLNVLQGQYFTTLSNFLSFLALERLAYQVTPNTKFKVEEDKLYIWEETPLPADNPSASDVATGSDTAQALGGKQ